MYHLLTQLPLTEEERNNLVVYSGSLNFYQCSTELEWCLLIFGTYSIGFILSYYIFHGLNTLRKLEKQADLLHSLISSDVDTEANGRRIWAECKSRFPLPHPWPNLTGS